MTATNRSLNVVDSPRSPEQIRVPRKASLAPLLPKRGLQLIDLPAGNFELLSHPGLLVKASHWRWPTRNLAGNTIDSFVQVLALSFADAMPLITEP